MDAERSHDSAISRIAAAIGEPARARMLCCLMDGRARTSTELSTVAEITPSTASVHLNRLRAEKLVRLQAQGRHRYYSLEGPDVARALEGLSVLAGDARSRFVPKTPGPLRIARSCYDHMAGAAAVALHDRFRALRWIPASSAKSGNAFDLTPEGARALTAWGIDIEAIRASRRRFAFGCLDWSERRPHIGGALGAALLKLVLTRKWMERNPDSRALSITPPGRRELRNRFGLEL
jgi:DNA-binding transcriptional ArsR family regulator